MLLVSNKVQSDLCPECGNTFYFTIESGGHVDLNCPHCEVGLEIEDKIDYQEQEDKTYQYKWLSVCLVIVCCVFIYVLMNTQSNLDIIENDMIVLREENEKYKIENTFMQGIGFDFTDDREPTNEELFTMEEYFGWWRNPSYNELSIFLSVDKTDTLPYTDWFVCGDFSRLLMSNSNNNNIRAGFVVIYQEEITDVPHAIVCFNTTDRGLIFVEPQGDKKFTLSEFNKMRDSNYYEYTDMAFSYYTIDWFELYNYADCDYDWYNCNDLYKWWNLYKEIGFSSRTSDYGIPEHFVVEYSKEENTYYEFFYWCCEFIVSFDEYEDGMYNCWNNEQWSCVVTYAEKEITLINEYRSGLSEFNLAPEYMDIREDFVDFLDMVAIYSIATRDELHFSNYDLWAVYYTNVYNCDVYGWA